MIDFARIFKAAGNPREHEYIVERDDAGTAALQTAKVGLRLPVEASVLGRRQDLVLVGLAPLGARTSESGGVKRSP